MTTLSLPLYPLSPRTPIEYETPRSPTPGCKRCKLAAETKAVCAPADLRTYTGPGGVLVVGSAPPKSEDYVGATAFSGDSGRYLRKLIADAGLTNVSYAYAVRCPRPNGEIPATDKVGNAAIAPCRPYLAEDLRKLKPSRILAVGDAAMESLLGEDAPRARTCRRALGWLSRAILSQPTPVLCLPDPLLALRHRTFRGLFESDVRWALGENVTRPPWRGTYEVITTLEECVAAVAEIRARYAARTTDDPYAALIFDVETTGLLWTPEHRVLCLAAALSSDGPGCDRGWLWGRAIMQDRVALAPLLALLEDPSIPVGGQNLKYDADSMRTAYGIEVGPIVFDTRLVSRLIEPDNDADLDNLGWLVACGGHKGEAEAHLKTAVRTVKKAEKIVANKNAGQGSLFETTPVVPPPGANAKTVAYGLLPPDVLERYATRDAITTARVASSLSHTMRTAHNAGPRWIYDDIVKRASGVFSRIESRGFPVDREGLFKVADSFGEQIEAARDAIRAVAPTLNPDSPEQIAYCLYVENGLKTDRETKGGNASTDKKALEDLRGQHPVIPHLLTYNDMTHLRSTYVDGMPEPGQAYGTGGMFRHLRRHPDGTWRVHSTYNLDGARTGRLSSSDPNLQNIPKAETVNGKLLKDLFVAPAGWQWLQLDYSQLELRVAAIVAQDHVMAEIFASGVDYHLRTAELIAPIAFGVTPAQWALLSDKQRKPYRSSAKNVNFGLLYGMGIKSLAARMGCDYATAEKTVKAILGKLAKLHVWLAQSRRETQATGYVGTTWKDKPGRRRPVHFMEYTDTVAVNSPIQGQASDYCLSSVCDIEDHIREDGLSEHAELVGTIHDSILFLVRERYLGEVAGIAADVMQGHGKGQLVRLDVDAEAGDRLGSLEKIKLTC